MFRSSCRFIAATALMLCLAAAVATCQTGQWQLVTPMPSGCNALGAVTGPDGRIYAIGGSFAYSLGGVVQAFDPRTNTWSFPAKMSQARQAPGCATGPDGRIYAIGGSWNGGSAEVYDIGANRWSPIASVPINTSTERVYSAAAGNDGRVYACITGDYGNFFFPYLMAYDIATNTWSTRIDPPISIPSYWTWRWTIVSDAGGRIYFTNGDSLFIFDPRANTWRSASPVPSGHHDYDFALTPGGDGRLYAIGTNFSYLGFVDAYDPAQDTWAAVSPLNVQRINHAATMGLDGRVYVLGGQDPSLGWGYYLTSVEAYQTGPASYIPAPPSGLIAAGGDRQVSLAWNPSAGADIYGVWRSASASGAFTNLGSTSATSFKDTSVVNGATYYYVVTATNAVGTSPYSNQVSATPYAVPAAPRNLTASAGKRKVTLQWTQSSTAGVTQNRIYRSTTNGSGYGLLGAVSGATSYNDNSVASGVTYYYVVTAVNGSTGKESAYSNQATAKPR